MPAAPSRKLEECHGLGPGVAAGGTASGGAAGGGPDAAGPAAGDWGSGAIAAGSSAAPGAVPGAGRALSAPDPVGGPSLTIASS